MARSSAQDPVTVEAEHPPCLLLRLSSCTLNHMNTPHITTLGLAYFRYYEYPFGIHQADRMMHCYVLGQTGTGKSTFLSHLARQDATHGTGFCLIDPHGDLAADLAADLGDRALYWPVADPDVPYGYNPLTHVSAQFRPIVASGLIETLRQQWADAWGVRMEHLLRHAILALLETPRTDLSDILRLFLERPFREQVMSHVSDPHVRQFWFEEYPKMNYKNAADGLAPIANKLGSFLAHPVIRTAVCEPKHPLRFRKIMDERKILLVNLSKGQLGADISNVLGGLIVSGITHAAFSRHSVAEHLRPDFMLYVDEFHNFTTESVADLLSETRKYRLGVIFSQQHTQQSSPAVFASVMGNAGTFVAFRVGANDAPIVSAQLGGTEPRDLIYQPNYRATVRMMLNGQPTHGFSMSTLPPPT